ncbi:MAG: hypothetical protein RL385_1214 [Pseudomonadota bacterium]|jgi:signal transduction histidine kinase
MSPREVPRWWIRTVVVYDAAVSMSLANRLVLVVLLALVGVGGAATAVLWTHRESDNVREETARALSASVADALVAKRDALARDAVEAIARGQPGPAALARFAENLIAPLADASAGFCLPDGTLLMRKTIVPDELSLPHLSQRPPPDYETFRGNLRDPKGLGLLPIDRDAVVAACRAHHTQTPDQIRFVAPRDTLLMTVAGGHRPFAAWALVRTPKRQHAGNALASPVLVFAIVFAMVALVALCIDTVLKVRKGIASLAQALVAVQSDLETSIPYPEPRELLHIADGLRAMTAHLSESRKRELALERRLSHERRLASLGRVAAGVAHEIRNPLAGIKLRLDAMARRVLDERTARDVSRSLGEVDRLDGVVGSLLLVARNQPAPLEAVDLTALVDERLQALEPFGLSRRVRVLREGAARAYVDAQGLARVIDNLVRNGIEASPEYTEVVVRLSVRDVDVELCVIDVGPGVPASRESEIFEPFFTSKPDGTGLGLCLSRAAVDAHGGSLSYARFYGKTSFIVRLPGKAIA